MAEVPRLGPSLNGEGSLAVAPDFSIAYKYRKGRGPLWIFLNGLGEDYASWDTFVDGLSREGKGRTNSPSTLQVDLRGQGLSLTEEHLNRPEEYLRFPFQTQADDLDRLLTHLGVDQPVRIAAFSYGGGVAIDFAARFAHRVDRLALVVPFVLRLDHAFPLQRLWGLQWRFAKGMGLVPPGLANVVERNYENFLSHYMNQRYSRRLIDPRQRRVAIELTHAIMDFNALEVVARLPDKSVFLMTSELDTLVPRSLYQEFWSNLPESKRGHWTRVEDGEHLLLEQHPELVLGWLREVASH